MFSFTFYLALFLVMQVIGAAAEYSPRVIRFIDASTVTLAVHGQSAVIHIVDHIADWTLMQIITTNAGQSEKYAILEDFHDLDGRLAFVDECGTKLNLPKPSESTESDSSRVYLGHTIGEII